MSHAPVDAEVVPLIREAAHACGLEPSEVRVLAVHEISPSDRRDLEAALSALLGRPCRSTLRELLDLEVRGHQCRIVLRSHSVDECTAALKQVRDRHGRSIPMPVATAHR